MILIWMPPYCLPVGTGGGRGPSEPKPVGVSGGGVPNGLWEQVSSSSFSIWACLLYPKQAHDERTERTHPDRPKISRHTRPLGNGSLGGAVFHKETPRPPPHYFPVLPAAQSGRYTPGAKATGRVESRGGSQALVGACLRRAVSEGLLPPTGQAPPEPSVTGGSKREEDSTSAQDRVGEGRGVSAQGNSGEENGDVTIGRMGGGGPVARVGVM